MPTPAQSKVYRWACTGNPGPGGWGVVVYYSDRSIYESGGNAAQATNNRMEMQAAIAALKLFWTQLTKMNPLPSTPNTD